MLVLSRHKGEWIICTVTAPIPVGTKIKIVVADVRGNRVRLGLDSPKELRIMRLELEDEKGD